MSVPPAQSGEPRRDRATGARRLIFPLMTLLLVVMSAGALAITLTSEPPRATAQGGQHRQGPSPTPTPRPEPEPQPEPELGAPRALRVTASGPRAVTLRWRPPAGAVGVDRYVIERDGARVATVTGTRWRDKGLAPGTRYVYRVIAVGETGERTEVKGIVRTDPAPEPGPAPVPEPSPAPSPAPTPEPEPEPTPTCTIQLPDACL